MLDATRRLLRERGAAELTIEGIARAAGVGRQTIYRWWPSRGAIVFEAASESARLAVPDAPDTGSLRGDLRAFLRASYQTAGRPDTAPILRAMAGEALVEEDFGRALRDFTAQRRAVLRTLLERHGADAARAALVAELGFGLLWYRLIVSGAPLDRAAADEAAAVLADAVERSAR